MSASIINYTGTRSKYHLIQNSTIFSFITSPSYLYMKHTLIILLLGITLGISSTALVNYLSNHDRDISHYTIQDNNTQIINDLRSKLQPDKYQKFEQIHTILQKEYYHTSGNIIDEKAMIESALHGFVH